MPGSGDDAGRCEGGRRWRTLFATVQREDFAPIGAQQAFELYLSVARTMWHVTYHIGTTIQGRSRLPLFGLCRCREQRGQSPAILAGGSELLAVLCRHELFEEEECSGGAGIAAA